MKSQPNESFRKYFFVPLFLAFLMAFPQPHAVSGEPVSSGPPPQPTRPVPNLPVPPQVTIMGGPPGVGDPGAPGPGERGNPGERDGNSSSDEITHSPSRPLSRISAITIQDHEDLIEKVEEEAETAIEDVKNNGKKKIKAAEDAKNAQVKILEEQIKELRERLAETQTTYLFWPYRRALRKAITKAENKIRKLEAAFVTEKGKMEAEMKKAEERIISKRDKILSKLRLTLENLERAKEISELEGKAVSIEDAVKTYKKTEEQEGPFANATDIEYEYSPPLYVARFHFEGWCWFSCLTSYDFDVTFDSKDEAGVVRHYQGQVILKIDERDYKDYFFIMQSAPRELRFLPEGNGMRTGNLSSVARERNVSSVTRERNVSSVTRERNVSSVIRTGHLSSVIRTGNLSSVTRPRDGLSVPLRDEAQ